MNVSIDEKTVDLLKGMLKEQNKQAVRISKSGVG